MAYEIRNKALTGISLKSCSYEEINRSYERTLKSVLDPETSCYGDVIVETEPVLAGWEVKARVVFRRQFWLGSWMPRWDKWIGLFRWLGLSVWLSPVHRDRVKGVVRDAVAEVEPE